MVQRIITAVLLVVWLILVVMGKGGFVHLLLLSAIGVGMAEVMAVIRSRLVVSGSDKL